jgi:hypothetical protein
MNDLFLSHSWEDKPFAFRLEADLNGHGVAVWVDHSELRPSQVLIDELQDAIEEARALGLLWSADASRSRWVKTEWQAAFLLEKTLVPCRLDDTALPLFLRTLLCCDFRTSYEAGLAGLVAAMDRREEPAAGEGQPCAPAPAPAGALPPASKPAGPGSRGFRWVAARLLSRFGGGPSPLNSLLAAPDLERLILEGQKRVLEALGRDDPAAAARPQRRVGALVEQALGRAGEDARLLSLAGYQRKNAYLIRHWSDVQRGTYPPDPLLEEAEDLFHESLSSQPNNPSAWNGLGSVLLLRGDLDAAEFFVKKALEMGGTQGAARDAAEADLRTITRRRGGPP